MNNKKTVTFATSLGMTAKMVEQPMTKKCRIAVQRAEKTLVKAKERLNAAQTAYDKAIEELNLAQYELSLNEELDHRKKEQE